MAVFRTVLVAKLGVLRAGVRGELGGRRRDRTRRRSPGPRDGPRPGGAPPRRQRPATIPELIAPIAHRLPWRGLVLAASAAIAAIIGGRAGRELAGRTCSGSTAATFGVDGPVLRARRRVLRVRAAGVSGARRRRRWRSIVLAGLLAVGVFWLRGAIDVRRPGELMPPAVVGLLSLLLALFLLAKAAGYWLGRYELLLEPYGAVFGAGYTVAHVKHARSSGCWSPRRSSAPGSRRPTVRARSWQLPVAAVVAGVRDGDRLVDPARRLPAPAGAPRRAARSSGRTSRRTSP